VRKPDGSIACDGNPETTLALGNSQVVLARGLIENCIRGVASEKLTGSELYSSDQVQLTRLAPVIQ
jgi:hypothetical protein